MGESPTRFQSHLLNMALLIFGWPYSFIISHMDPTAATEACLSARDTKLLFGGLEGMNPCSYALLGPLVDVIPILLLLAFIQLYVSNVPPNVVSSFI